MKRPMQIFQAKTARHYRHLSMRDYQNLPSFYPADYAKLCSKRGILPDPVLDRFDQIMRGSNKAEQAVWIEALRVYNNQDLYESYGRHHRPVDAWRSFEYVVNRGNQSTLIDESNQAAIEEIMEPFFDDGTAEKTSAGHWAVGRLDCIEIKIWNAHNRITPAFRAYCEIARRLENYPILDEHDHCDRESAQTWENVKEAARYFFGKFDPLTLADKAEDLTDEHIGDLYSWLNDNDPNSLESSDDQGGYPDDDELANAGLALGWITQAQLDENNA